jgi:hypothetical protein
MLNEPRHDFPIQVQPQVATPTSDGTYVAGLLRVSSEGLTVTRKAGRKQVEVSLPIRVVDPAGREVVRRQRKAAAPVAADGSALFSYGATLGPGHHTVQVGLYDSAGRKGSWISEKVDVPRLDMGGLCLSRLMVLAGIHSGEKAESDDPLVDYFVGGGLRLVPRFDNVLSRPDSLSLLASGSGALLGHDGKAQVTTRFTVLQDGRELISSPERSFDTASFMVSVDSVPLESFPSGELLARFTARDEVAGVEEVQETRFRIEP